MRPAHRWVCALLALWLAPAPGASGRTPGVGPAPLRCTLQVPASVATGQPVRLSFSLSNRGPRALQVLRWGTPFDEAWFAAWATVTRDGVPLVYQGAAVKRGEPVAGEYLRLAVGQARRASVELAAAFDVAAPGRYRVQPHIVLHDVTAGAVPRVRSQHAGQPLACRAVEFTVRG